MESIKKRGVKQVLLFASDGLAGMRDAVKRQFPEAEFLSKYGKRYPKLAGIFERAKESLYPFYKFPEAIRKSIYTTNMIEEKQRSEA